MRRRCRVNRKVQAPLVSAQQGRASAEAPQSSQPPNESCGTLGARPGIEPGPHAWGTVHDAAVLRARVRTVLDLLKSPLSEISSARSVAASYKPPMLVTRVRLPACPCVLHIVPAQGQAPAGLSGAYIYSSRAQSTHVGTPATALLWGASATECHGQGLSTPGATLPRP